MKNEDLNQYQSAYKEKFKYFDENMLILDRFSQFVIDAINKFKYTSVLSLGIGHAEVIRNIIAACGEKLENYTMVEGAKDIIDDFLKSVGGKNNINVVHSYFENFTTDTKFDIIEMGFVLEHVDDPFVVLNRFKDFLKEGGQIHIGVPNARSLHRLLGHEAGFLKDIYALGPADIQLGHKRYFDLRSFKELVESCSLKIDVVAGLMLKPVTTGQIASLDLPDSVTKALVKVGVEFPDICNGIYIQCSK